MVIGLQIGKLHGGGGGIHPPALPDSEKPGLFRVKICEDYNVPHDPMRYRDENFYWTYQKKLLLDLLKLAR